jgi:sugar transferase EpsL
MQMTLKRIFDIGFAGIAILILSPLLFITAACVFISMGRPVLFRQCRPGYKEKIFTLYKFRSMNEDRDEKGNLLPNKDRLTKLGKFLRSWSIDELPQLWNVLKGDLSIIGPRPLLVEYLPLYTPDQHRRHDVKPGLVGWAGVNGRNANTWEKKFELDLWYVDHWSLWLDIKIFFMAILTVLKREGIYQENEISASKFSGTTKKE